MNSGAFLGYKNNMTKKDWDGASRMSVWWGVINLLVSRWIPPSVGTVFFYMAVFFVILGMLNLPKRPTTKEQLFDPNF